jgi:integrase
MAVSSTKTVTLQGLMEFVSNDESLTQAQKAAHNSALRAVSKVCGKHLSEIIADPQVIRKLLAGASWQLAGLSKSRWANVQSLLTSAMKLAGVKVSRRRKNRKLDESWKTLLAPLSRRDHDELHPFAGWCSTLGVAPSDVDPSVFRRYLDHLEHETIQRNPRERWHVARRAWNRTMAALPGSLFPIISNVDPDSWRGLKWEAFLPSLLADIEAYKITATTKDPFAEAGACKPVTKITLDNHLNNLRWYLSVLVQNGVPISHFTTLRDCLDPALVKRALLLRLGGREIDDKTAPGLNAMASALVSIARRIGVSDDDLFALSCMARRVRHRPKGMCERNRVRLAQLEDPAARRALINLPFEMAQQLAHVKVPTVRQAQTMQDAVLLAFILFFPIRIKNVAGLDLDKHFVRPVGSATGRWLVHFDPHEVKNKTAIDGSLNEHLSAMLARYVEVFRPVLLKTTTSKLFIGQNGTEKDPHTLGRQFFNLIKRCLGLKVNAHLMRHFAGFVYLEANPGHYEPVRQMLGHKNIDTTIRFYSGTATKAAFERYDALISAEIDLSHFERVRGARRGSKLQWEFL